MIGIKVICEANGKRSKYDIEQVKAFASDNTQPFQQKVYGEILKEIDDKQDEILDFDDRYTIFFVSPTTESEFEETGDLVRIRNICYFKESVLKRL